MIYCPSTLFIAALPSLSLGGLLPVRSLITVFTCPLFLWRYLVPSCPYTVPWVIYCLSILFTLPLPLCFCWVSYCPSVLYPTVSTCPVFLWRYSVPSCLYTVPWAIYCPSSPFTTVVDLCFCWAVYCPSVHYPIALLVLYFFGAIWCRPVFTLYTG